MIQVEDADKIRITKSGANKLFGVEYDERQNMSSEKLIEWFDTQWCNIVKELVEKAEVCRSHKEVIRRLPDKYHSFIEPEQEHRSFRYRQAEFIVQLQPLDDNQYRLNQLWRVTSSDVHPKTLFVNFSTVEERDRFEDLATKLGIEDEKLGLQLVRNFMNLHPGYEADQ